MIRSQIRLSSGSKLEPAGNPFNNPYVENAEGRQIRITLQKSIHKFSRYSEPLFFQEMTYKISVHTCDLSPGNRIFFRDRSIAQNPGHPSEGSQRQ